MELHQLRCFVAVAEELHFGRAARRLFMTQPPLSRQIQLLERDLGVQLLERSNRQVRLTAAGVGFLRDARHVLLFAERAGETARSLARGSSGRLSLGFTAVAGYRLIPELVRHLQGALPEVDLVLQEQVTTDQTETLAAQMIDVGFLRQLAPRGPLLGERVWREPLLLALPPGHPLAGQRAVSVRALEHQPFVMYAPGEGRYFYDSIAGLFASTGVRPRFVQHLGQTHSILGLVRAGVGVALLPASAAHLHVDQVCFRPLTDAELHAEVWMAWREDNSNPALPLFLHEARRYFTHNPGSVEAS